MKRTQAEISSARPDIVMMTFDALRFDVADEAWQSGRTPCLRMLLPQGWEARHSPGNFTYAAHAALFAGFWPTPSTPGEHVRPFALKFPGSRTIGDRTLVLTGDNIVRGLQAAGYRTICIGGVGFFNPVTPLGRVFPGYFQHSYWRQEFSVSALRSAQAQTQQAQQCIRDTPLDEPLFLFVNFSATHPPTHGYVRGAVGDTIHTQTAALESIDRELPKLFDVLRTRPRGGAGYLMSDHGTLFGEDGWRGHRVSHPAVWTVPYAECRWGAPA